MTIEATERPSAGASPAGVGGQQRPPLDPELSRHEAWRALCQLDARERRGEAMAAVDAAKLRRHLETRVRAELPGLAHHLPAPTAAMVRPWPLLVAVAVALQGAGGFRTGLRVKPSRQPPLQSPGEVRAGNTGPAPGPAKAAEAPPVLPPFTVTPPPVQPAARRAAALVRAELDRRAAPEPARLGPGLRQRLLTVAVNAPSPAIEAPAAAAPVSHAAVTQQPPATPPDDFAARLRQIEIDSAELTIRSVAMGASPFAYRPDAAGPWQPADAHHAMTVRGIVVEVAVDDPSEPPGLEGGLLHQEEAEVTIVSLEPTRASTAALAGGEAHAGASSAEGSSGHFEEAEVEIVLPGERPRGDQDARAAAQTVDRFLGALIGKS